MSEEENEKFLDTTHKIAQAFADAIHKLPPTEICFAWEFEFRAKSDGTSMQIITTITRLPE